MEFLRFPIFSLIKCFWHINGWGKKYLLSVALLHTYIFSNLREHKLLRQKSLLKETSKDNFGFKSTSNNFIHFLVHDVFESTASKYLRSLIKIDNHTNQRKSSNFEAEKIFVNMSWEKQWAGSMFIMFGKKAPSISALSFLYTAEVYKELSNR